MVAEVKLVAMKGEYNRKKARETRQKSLHLFTQE